MTLRKFRRFMRASRRPLAQKLADLAALANEEAYLAKSKWGQGKTFSVCVI